MAGGEHGERTQHVGVALAGDEVADGHQRGLRVPRDPGGGEVGAEVHHARLPRAVGAGELGDAAAVGEHQAGGAEPARDGLAADGGAGGGVEHVAAMDGDHEGLPEPDAAHRLAGGNRVVSVDQIEAPPSMQAPQGDPQRGRGPGAPGGVGAPAGRGDVGDIGDREAVVELVHTPAHPLAQHPPERSRTAHQSTPTGIQGGARRHEAVQDEHVHLCSRGLRGERLAVGPDPQHGIAATGIELRYDGHPHQWRWVRRVVWASRAPRWGRLASRARASATAASRE